MRLTRPELYALVWAEPMQRLAQRFGISDVAIAKRCKRLAIPVPPRGYWARKAAGQTVRVPVLPNAPAGMDAGVVEFAERARADEDETPAAREGPVWEQEQFEALPENRIAVSTGLSRHPAIRATSAYFRERRGPLAGQVSAWGDGVLDVKVARQQVGRALHFLDAFVRACEVRGFAVRGYKSDENKCRVAVLGQPIEFRLREPQRRVDLLKESGTRLKPGEYMYPRHRFDGTGQFEFHIGSPYSIARAAWRDGKRRRIEECLNEIMVALVTSAVALTEQAARVETELAERRRLAELEQQEESQRKAEEQRITQLQSDVDGWSRAERLRAFAVAVEGAALARLDGKPLPIDAAAWVEWVHYMADELDPLMLADPISHLTRTAPDPLPEWMRRLVIIDGTTLAAHRTPAAPSRSQNLRRTGENS